MGLSEMNATKFAEINFSDWYHISLKYCVYIKYNRSQFSYVKRAKTKKHFILFVAELK